MLNIMGLENIKCRDIIPVLLFKRMTVGKLFPLVRAIGDFMLLILSQNKSLVKLIFVLFWLIFILIIERLKIKKVTLSNDSKPNYNFFLLNLYFYYQLAQ